MKTSKDILETVYNLAKKDLGVEENAAFELEMLSMISQMARETIQLVISTLADRQNEDGKIMIARILLAAFWQYEQEIHARFEGQDLESLGKVAMKIEAEYKQRNLRKIN